MIAHSLTSEYVSTLQRLTISLFALVIPVCFFEASAFAQAAVPKIDLSEFYKIEDWKLVSSIKWRTEAEMRWPVLLIRFQCVSGNGPVIYENPTIVDYHIHVFDETGVEIPVNAEGKLRDGVFYGSAAFIKTIGPGQELSYEIDLKKYFGVSPGRAYEVRVRRYLTSYIIPRDSVPEPGVRLEHVDAPPIKFNWK